MEMVCRIIIYICTCISGWILALTLFFFIPPTPCLPVHWLCLHVFWRQMWQNCLGIDDDVDKEVCGATWRPEVMWMDQSTHAHAHAHANDYPIIFCGLLVVIACLIPVGLHHRTHLMSLTSHYSRPPKLRVLRVLLLCTISHYSYYLSLTCTISSHYS